ncbi:unnamed protein product [Nyctereutes procyonoides]|uniref:(raccoon dog) hypothetical protein n=1 Tax=Nyctereutes procyonoides TaxID=34880 RepID=A0A811Z2S6_NYCPR|nr:unnamed protein product [Nyctereutes procyonoides]
MAVMEVSTQMWLGMWGLGHYSEDASTASLIQEAGGAFGKKEQKHHEDEITHHVKEIEHLQKEIEWHKKKIKKSKT